MHKPRLIIKPILICSYVLLFSSTVIAQITKVKEVAAIDMQKARTIIENLDKQFSKDYLDGDSLALAAFYSKNGQLGSLKGKEILSYWSRSIQSSIKNNTRHLLFTTTALTGDAELLVELGNYELKDDKDNLKESGKYLVVWKLENGEWKLYRDIGL